MFRPKPLDADESDDYVPESPVLGTSPADREARGYSRLLIDEHPQIFYPSLATRLTLEEAIVLQQFQFWLGRTKNIRDGKRWIYNTYAEWQKQFPYMSTRTVRRVIKSLEERGLLVVGNYNRMPTDQTKWYTIDYDVLDELNAQEPPKRE